MKDKLKTEIVKTARNLLQEGKDIRHITMNLIAKKMGITAPTLYHYFKGKEEIIVMSIELIADELLETFQTPLPNSMPPDMKLQMRIVTAMSYFYKNINSFSLAFSDSGIAYWGSGDIPLSEKIKAFRANLQSVIKEWLDAEGIKYDALKSAFVLIGLMMGCLRHFKSNKILDADITIEAENVYEFFKYGIIAAAKNEEKYRNK